MVLTPKEVVVVLHYSESDFYRILMPQSPKQQAAQQPRVADWLDRGDFVDYTALKRPSTYLTSTPASS